MARVIESPGVQITEIDLSQNATLPDDNRLGKS